MVEKPSQTMTTTTTTTTKSETPQQVTFVFIPRDHLYIFLGVLEM